MSESVPNFIHSPFTLTADAAFVSYQYDYWCGSLDCDACFLLGWIPKNGNREYAVWSAKEFRLMYETEFPEV